jgi:hypothetical protein
VLPFVLIILFTLMKDGIEDIVNLYLKILV